ncbi:MAG: RecQ family ATP-dependent DNA helicase, partial [Desulfobulbaceae bacterium]|nr:RecQ family ATP-dependent DNA helicase [Desulfobulbaceae bacterium]
MLKCEVIFERTLSTKRFSSFMQNSPDIQDTLQTVFGFPSFLPGQQEVIDKVVSGRSALAVFPTGQGKSLCYQLPALHLPGLTLVVSPLMALMKDQVDFLVEKGVAAARLDSSLDLSQVTSLYENLRAGKIKLLYIAPERFANERFVHLVERLSISLMVVDEAHCISEWGHNFRPDYLKLAGLAGQFNIPSILALTATATPEVVFDITNGFSIAREDVVQTGFYRPNLTLDFIPSDDPLAQLVSRLNKKNQGAAIVYVTLQKTAEQVAASLTGQGITARPYHAGMKDEDRQSVQDWFMENETAIVVATIAFGMGIDKSDIRAVYHYNLPKSLENYAQEIGRAGRDGKPSVCTMLGSGRDLITLENFIYGDTPDDQAVHDLIDHLLLQPERFDISIYELAGRFDMRALVEKTLLTYLELEGLIGATGPFYSMYKFKPLRSSKEIFARFDQQRVAFLTTLFSCAVQAKTWFTININEAMEKTESPRQRIVKALDYLQEQGDLELQVTGARLGYGKMRAV